MLIWEKYEKKTKETKEHELRINMDKTVTTRISRTLDTGVGIRVNDT
jgi:hypothetical protein